MQEQIILTASTVDPTVFYDKYGRVFRSSPQKRVEVLDLDTDDEMVHQPPIQQQQKSEPTTALNITQQGALTTQDKKRKRSPDHAQHQANHTKQPQKQTKLDYWLGVKTTNLFSALAVEDVDNETHPKQIRKVPKPPPIFVDGVQNIVPLQDMLKEVAKASYVLKVINNECVKIQATEALDYKEICQELVGKQTSFHTYQLKGQRNYRVILRNMHYSTNPEDISEALAAIGHTAVNVHNIKQRVTKKPLSMFLIELATNENNKKIYDVDLLLHQKVIFEPPHQKREIPQCLRCQQYGHTKKFCNRRPGCVKCIEDHATEECPRKVRNSDVKCVLCNGSHPANYRGCLVHKELQAKKFPLLRKKEIVAPKLITNPNFVQPGISYAQMAKENQEDINKNSQSQLQNTQQPNDIIELKNMMKDLMQQMGTMLNLLTTIVSKMA